MDRLEEIFSCIKKSGVVADIGCDHGKLEEMLICAGRADRVIATDISAKSLEKAVLACGSFSCGERIDFRRGDGLSVLAAGEADVIVIAGMGGTLIANILRDDIKTAKGADLVLCPHSHEGTLRRFLLENGFNIYEEKLAMEEGRYYQIFCARFDGVPRREEDGFYYEIGRALLKGNSPLLVSFLSARLDKTIKIIQKSRRSDKGGAKKRTEELSAFAKKLEEWIHVCETERN